MKKRLYVPAIVLLVTMLLAACGGGGGGGTAQNGTDTPNTATIHPSVTATTPANSATGIAPNAALTATFSEAVDPATVNASTFTVNNGVTGTVTYDATNNIATFTPTVNLAYSTSYTATITTGVKDAAGNAMTADYSWSFTTGSAPDTTPPTVSSTNPANSATAVAANTAISATFSEALDGTTVTDASFLVKDAGNNPVSGAVGYAGTTATFTPAANLNYSAIYTATITTAVKDLAGNALAANYTWSFTTGGAPDTTPPTVSSVTPTNNATNVSINPSIAATFSEAVKALTTSTFLLKNGSTPVTGTVVSSGVTATFTPSSSLAYSTVYTASVTTGVQDLAGNALASAFTWTFTTASAPDTTPPTVTSVTPTNGATGVLKNAAVTATFSEAMLGSTITGTSFQLKDAGNNPVGGSVGYDSINHIATFTSTSNLAGLTSYTATITTGVTDLAGNHMAANKTWSFTTVGAVASVDNGSNGLNYDPTVNIGDPQITAFNGKLYAAWDETDNYVPQIRVAVYNGNDASPSWARVDGGGITGINHNIAKFAKEPQLTVFNAKLYALWKEYDSALGDTVRVAVYNGNDSSPAWTFVDGDVIDGLYVSSLIQFPQLTVSNGKLYALWEESGAIHVAKYSGDDSAPSWSYVDAGALAGSRGQLTDFNSSLYATYMDGSNRVRVFKYNGNDGSPGWSAVDNGANGINVNPAKSAQWPQLTVANGKLYAIWSETNASSPNGVQVAVYNGNDSSPAWTAVSSTSVGLNWSSTGQGFYPQLTAFNGTLYATWNEYTGSSSSYQVHVIKYNGDDTNPSWTFVDNGANGIATVSTVFYPQMTVFNSKLYATWQESSGTYHVRVGVYTGN